MSRLDSYESMLSGLETALVRSNELNLLFIAEIIKMAYLEACNSGPQFIESVSAASERCQDKS